jgi:hypothetical protein
MVSDGTDTVIIDGNPVKFPTTVTDAAWAPDGSRIAFIDADSNIATARPDGSDLVVLTKAGAGVRRSNPTWDRRRIIFTEWAADGSSKLRQVQHTAARGERFVGGIGDMENPELPGSNAAPSSSRDGRLVYQHDSRDGLEVWVIDTNAREPVAGRWVEGGAGEITPDGTKLAYVAENGQISVISDLGERGRTPVQVTFGVDSPSHLAWTPDGSRIGFQTPTGVGSVVVDVPAGTTSNPVTELSSTSGVPSFLPPAMDATFRIDTIDLVATTVAASKQRWPDRPADPDAWEPGQAASAIIVGVGDRSVLDRSYRLMSMANQGPVLATSGAGLDPRVRDELRRALGTVPADWPVDSGPMVTILGAEDSVPAQTEQDIRALGYRTQRTNGAALADPGPQPYVRDLERILIADLGDPLAAALASASLGYYVVYSDGGTLSAEQKAIINRSSPSADVRTIGPLARQAMSASWPNKPKWTVSDLPVDGPEFVVSMSLVGPGIVLVDQGAATDLALAVALAWTYGYTLVPVDPGAPLPTDLRTWLSQSSAFIDQVLAVTSDDRLDIVEAAVAHVVSGPLGHAVAPPAQPSASD